MPFKSLRRGTWYGVLGTVTVSALACSLALAQSVPVDDAGDKLFSIWSKEGLFAAIAVGLVVWSVWGQHQSTAFIRQTLVDLVQNNQAFIVAATDAIKASQCGQEFDSAKIATAKEKIAGKKKPQRAKQQEADDD